MRRALAVDIGGTKLAAAVVDDTGDVVRRTRRPTPATTDPEVLWSAVVALLDEVRDGDEVVCGVGCGGPMSPGGDAVSPLHLPAWRGFPLRARLARHVGVPVAIDNDAKAIALAEGWRGAAAGVSSFVGMVVSTGVGGGIVLDRHLLGGNAGHIGHVIVRPGGRPCRCGGRGCLEAEASGTAIHERTGRPAAEATPAVVAETGRLVGDAVASVCRLLDLHLAVVAGSVAFGWGAPFFAAAAERLGAAGRIEPAWLGDAAPLVGAAAIGWRALDGET